MSQKRIIYLAPPYFTKEINWHVYNKTLFTLTQIVTNFSCIADLLSKREAVIFHQQTMKKKVQDREL
jgi:site-specific DNA-adenine methylase